MGVPGAVVVVVIDVDVGAPEPRWTQMKSSANLSFNGFSYYSKPGKLEAGATYTFVAKVCLQLLDRASGAGSVRGTEASEQLLPTKT